MAKDKEEKKEKDNDYGTLAGFRNLMRKNSGQMPEPSSGTAKTPNMADGGVPLSDALTSINQTPPTNYDFYKTIGAEDRAKLYQQILSQQHSGGNLVASGLAGVGDAISNSFGGKNTTFQKGVEEGAATNAANQIGAVDTQRTQRLQDMQGSQMAMENDPNHPMAHAMRETFKSAGLNVPSGMPISVMMKIAPAIGDLAIKQSTAATQAGAAAENVRHNRVAEGQAATNQSADETEKSKTRKANAAEGLQKRPWYQKGAELIPAFESDATKEMKTQLHDDEEKPSTGGWKVVR